MTNGSRQITDDLTACVYQPADRPKATCQSRINAGRSEPIAQRKAGTRHEDRVRGPAEWRHQRRRSFAQGSDRGTVRDQAHADAERAAGAFERVGPAVTPESLRRFALSARRKLRNETEHIGGSLCERSPTVSRSPVRARHENRAFADTCRRCGSKIGGRWRSQFYTEVAHPARFELTTFAFGGQRSIQLSYGCIWPARDRQRAEGTIA
jgi:hypothetical protein